MKPAWVDDDDKFPNNGELLEKPFIVRNVEADLDELAYRTRKMTQKRLRERYITSSIYGRETQKWVKPEDDEKCDSSVALNAIARFAGTTNIGSKSLPAKELKFTLLRDPTIGHQQGTVNCLKFHPSMPILVSALSTGRIVLFQICDDVNNLLLRKSNFFLQDVTIPNISFDNITFFDRGSLFASANNRNDCYIYDLLIGEITQIKQPKAMDKSSARKIRLSADGNYIAYLVNNADIFVFLFKTMDHLHTYRGAENIVDFCFSPINREQIVALAVNGTVYIWNLIKYSEVIQFFDEGCVKATCMAFSLNGQFLACGSNTGIVNVYDMNDYKWLNKKQNSSQRPLLFATFDQLTTSVSWLEFSKDAQLLAMGSTVKKMAVRLGHLASGTVFQNFPSRQEHFSKERLTTCAFSPKGAFFAVGTKEGRTRLYQLKHFEKY
uniref:Uncharacterized protein n=3 Tax=Meloidogyne TaxID=189290 RepID=A0A6V7X7J1_MELEN|nr:unnamed protein product [Meloidogyne enterolobii]